MNGGAVVSAAPIGPSNMVNGATKDDIIVLDDEDHAKDDVIMEDCVKNGNSNGMVKFGGGLNLDKMKSIVKMAVTSLDEERARSKEAKISGNLFEKLSVKKENDVNKDEGDSVKNDSETSKEEKVESPSVCASGDSKDNGVSNDAKNDETDATDDKCPLDETSSDDLLTVSRDSDVLMLELEKDTPEKPNRVNEATDTECADESQNSAIIITNSESSESKVENEETETVKSDDKSENSLENETKDDGADAEIVNESAAEADIPTNVDNLEESTDNDKSNGAEKTEIDLPKSTSDISETNSTNDMEVTNEIKDDIVVPKDEEDHDMKDEKDFEEELLHDDRNGDNSRPSSVASVKSDILLESPVNSPKKESEVIVLDTNSRKRPISQSSVGSDESSVKKSRVGLAGTSSVGSPRISDTDTKDDVTQDDEGSESGEVLTVLNDEMLHGLVKQKLDGLLSKEIDQIVSPLHKRISELKNLNQLWKDKVVNLQKQINDMDMVKQRTEHKRGVASRPAMRTVAVQVCTTLRSTAQQKTPPQPAPPIVVKQVTPTKPPTMVQQQKPVVIYAPQAKSQPAMSSPVPTITSVRLTQGQPSAIRAPTPQSSQTFTSSSLGGTQTFVISPPQSSISSSLTSSLSQGLSIMQRKSTVREMLSSRTSTTQIMPVSSIMNSVNKPATIQLPSGNRVVIDLTSDEEKNKLAGLVQGGLVVPKGGLVVPTSIALQTTTSNAVQNSQQPILLTGGNNMNMPMILQTLQGNSGNSNNPTLLLTGQNSQGVMTLVHAPSGQLVQKGSSAPGTVLSAPLSVQQSNRMPTMVNTMRPSAVPVSLQRAPNVPVQTSANVLGTIRVRVPASAMTGFTQPRPTAAAVHPAAPQHPAPLPPHPVSVNSVISARKEPPRPTLKISRVAQGIVLSWNMAITNVHEEITNYQLYAYQEGNASPSTSLWKRVGDVKALPLPMACTLTQFQEGNKYHFAVRAVDKCSRVGNFSEPASIYLAPSKSD